jgi:hypothetical protein
MAYEYLNSISRLDNDTQQIILFLSDGQPTDTTDVLTAKVAQRPSGSQILTYGLGDITNWNKLEILSDLSDGNFTKVENAEFLRTDMASFYTFIVSKFPSNEPVMTVPCVDAFGMGLLISMAGDGR